MTSAPFGTVLWPALSVPDRSCSRALQSFTHLPATNLSLCEALATARPQKTSSLEEKKVVTLDQTCFGMRLTCPPPPSSYFTLILSPVAVALLNL
ncbi:hypothetical protein RRG08_025750 [Elysia crispata]|uniref:Uncharacterized protein n=1 Tax=Elysia crispata TaxID=231223 RepID=A0AAE1DYK5_9GAST|nr:hypothetical protein RRG08_025750 [Elysia crispata]